MNFVSLDHFYQGSDWPASRAPWEISAQTRGSLGKLMNSGTVCAFNRKLRPRPSLLSSGVGGRITLAAPHETQPLCLESARWDMTFRERQARRPNPVTARVRAQSSRKSTDHMNLRTAARRIVQGELQYVFGRFKTLRTCYSGFQRLRDWLGREPAGSARQQPTLFPATDVDQAVRAIKDEAVFVGLRLPRHIVDQIEAFCRSEPLHPGNDPDAPTFNYAGVVRGQTDDGRPMVLGGVRDPVRCAAVKEVVDDPVLRAICTQYPGIRTSSRQDTPRVDFRLGFY